MDAENPLLNRAKFEFLDYNNNKSRCRKAQKKLKPIVCMSAQMIGLFF